MDVVVNYRHRSRNRHEPKSNLLSKKHYLISSQCASWIASDVYRYNELDHATITALQQVSATSVKSKENKSSAGLAAFGPEIIILETPRSHYSIASV